MQLRSTRNLPLLALMALLISALALTGCNQKPVSRSSTAVSGPRIVSLAPSMTEMLYAIGAGNQIVGRTTACDWPIEVKKVPVVGAFGRPSLEMLASIKPDIVVEIDLDGEQTGKNISSLGLRREHIECKTPDDVPSALRKLGQLSGHTQKADSLASVIEQGLATYRKEAATTLRKTKVYLEIWDDPLWTGGKHSFTSTMINYAGGINIGDEVDKEYFEVSPEWVIRQNPDVIACMYMSKETPAVTAVRSRAGWSGIEAVRNDRIHGNFDNNIYLRPGPRVLEGISGLKRLLGTK
ncbi:MAG: cobalamin-binding protein [Chlorobiaceae bacterium]|nr:cobalamin-binding protein [Chlorobiaceae bacterium]